MTAEETTRTEAVGIAEEGAGMKIVGVLGTMNTAGCDGKTLTVIVIFPFAHSFAEAVDIVTVDMTVLFCLSLPSWL